MPAATELAEIVKTVEVASSPEHAFNVFTEQLDSWWPTASHSIGEDKVAALVVEAHEGGRIIERWTDGTEYDWARFTTWEPPRRFVMDWRPNPEPGPYTEVEVTFTPSGDVTIVELVHRRWERLGDAGPGARRDYSTGWDPVLALYVVAAS